MFFMKDFVSSVVKFYHEARKGKITKDKKKV